jgi:hypothetical protein
VVAVKEVIQSVISHHGDHKKALGEIKDRDSGGAFQFNALHKAQICNQLDCN